MPLPCCILWPPQIPLSSTNAWRLTTDVDLPNMSPHAPFKEVEASRPSFPHQPDGDAAVAFSKTVQPDWQVGGGQSSFRPSHLGLICFASSSDLIRHLMGPMHIGLNSHPLATKHAASQPRTKLDPSQMAGGAIYNLMTSGIGSSLAVCFPSQPPLLTDFVR
jgi:hypothetical protein